MSCHSGRTRSGCKQTTLHCTEGAWAEGLVTRGGKRADDTGRGPRLTYNGRWQCCEPATVVAADRLCWGSTSQSLHAYMLTAVSSSTRPPTIPSCLPGSMLPPVSSASVAQDLMAMGTQAVSVLLPVPDRSAVLTVSWRGHSRVSVSAWAWTSQVR